MVVANSEGTLHSRRSEREDSAPMGGFQSAAMIDSLFVRKYDVEATASRRLFWGPLATLIHRMLVSL
jgi:hypothetical protein